MRYSKNKMEGNHKDIDSLPTLTSSCISSFHHKHLISFIFMIHNSLPHSFVSWDSYLFCNLEDLLILLNLFEGIQLIVFQDDARRWVFGTFR